MTFSKLTRIINILEPLICYILIIVILWLISSQKMTETSIYIIACLLILWILFLSPIFHFHLFKERNEITDRFRHYFSTSRGFGNFLSYYSKDSSKRFNFIQNWSFIRNLTIIIDILLIGVVFGLGGDVTDFIEDLFGNSDIYTAIGATLIFIAVIDVVLVFIFYPVLIRLDSGKNAWKQGLLKSLVTNIIIYAISAFIIGIFWSRLVVFLGVQPFGGLQGENSLNRLISINYMKILGYWAEYLFPCWAILLILLGCFQTQLNRALITSNSRKRTDLLIDSIIGLMFACLHLPNFWLFIIMLASGFFLSRWYRKSQNLIVISLSYSFLISLIYLLLPIYFNISLFLL
jgi:hypothetical protein